MSIEYEIAFLNTPHDMMRDRIVALGGICTQPRTLMRRIAFRNPIDPIESFVRVRDEGGKITCTYKKIPSENLGIDSVRELECEVSDFETMKHILLSLGIPQKSYQETYRETWRIGEVECMLDEWPGLKPFVEIE